MSGPWASLAPATCWPSDCFCEEVRAGLVAQPANTWSSLLFLAAAALVWHRRDRAAATPAGVLAAALVVIGLGSAFYHASLSFAGQFVDVLGMYLLATFVLLQSLAARGTLGPRAFVTGYVALNAALATLLLLASAARRWAFAALVLAALGAELTRPGCPTRRWLGASAAVLAFGFGLWTLDLLRLACRPTSLLQGHAAWHLCGAVSAVLLARHYRGARPVAMITA